MAFQEVIPEESSEFRTDSFVDTITSIEFIEKYINEDLKNMVSFNFAEGASLDFFEPDDWSELKDFMGIGRIIADLKKTGVKFQVDLENRMLRTVPSIIGAKVSFKVTKTEKMVNGNTKTYTNWNIDNIQLSDGAGSSNTTESNVTNEEVLLQTEDIIKECIESGGVATKKDVIRYITNKITDAEERKPIQKCRDDVLQSMVDEGIIVLNGNEYTIA